MAMCVSMAGGLVLAASWFLPMQVEFSLMALVIWIAGVVALGVLGYRDGRRNGMGYWSSLRRATRQFLGGLWGLMP